MAHKKSRLVLSQIYTRVGDDGTTALGDMSRVRKTDPRVEAYGDVDEANSTIGVALALGELPDAMVRVLTRVQNELFDVGADICAPVVPDPEFPPLRIDDAYVERLERDCDTFNAELATLRSFVLPAGTKGAALLHVARTVVRRAERTSWQAVAVHGETINATPVAYLNRLSDLLFILARAANAEAGDVEWVPGGDR
ncbi:MAG: cob(I)yrinic acid a,c-diamide adenosyltransferase [Streptosporangiales bacterium]|nr:cob(I)yrinic acid a,c-diamide adenosyltransferase [Streptosporangiales bacterium]MBO0889968.1 cob(I)yrinic acid a,c-diamide adenosyltransferase [Acidothermales bacterium]